MGIESMLEVKIAQIFRFPQARQVKEDLRKALAFNIDGEAHRKFLLSREHEDFLVI
jgi:hypothetical protein